MMSIKLVFNNNFCSTGHLDAFGVAGVDDLVEGEVLVTGSGRHVEGSIRRDGQGLM